MAFALWSGTLDHFPKSFKANKMVKLWGFGSLSLCLVLLGFFLTSTQAIAQTKFCTVNDFYKTGYSVAEACGKITLDCGASVGIKTLSAFDSTHCNSCLDRSGPLVSCVSVTPTPVPPTPTPTPTPAKCDSEERKSVNVRTKKNRFANCVAGCIEVLSGCGNSAGLTLEWFGEETMDCKYSSKPGTNCTAPPEPDDPKCPPECGEPTPGPTPSGPPTPVPTPVTLPKDCKAGTCYGEVNGVGVCIKCAPVDKTDVTTTVTNSDGSKTTTTSTTTCDGDICSTKTTTKTTPAPGTAPSEGGGDGTTTDTTRTDEPASDYCKKNPRVQACKDRDDAEKKGFCEENPDIDVCKKGEFSSSSCEAEPTCSGDPVQCAQAKQAFKSACETKKLNDAISGEASELPGAKGIVDSAISQGLGNSSLITDTDSVSVGSFDQTNPWGSSCPADRTIAAFEGHNIEFKLSEYCSIFQLMGTLAVAFTLLAAGLFVFKD